MGDFSAVPPWRLDVEDRITGDDSRGCAVTLKDRDTGTVVWEKPEVYARKTFQMTVAGRLQWEVSDPGCIVVPRPGAGLLSLPQDVKSYEGDTDALQVAGQLAVQVRRFAEGSSSCQFSVISVDTRLTLGSATIAAPNRGRVLVPVDSSGLAYLHDVTCDLRILTR